MRLPVWNRPMVQRMSPSQTRATILLKVPAQLRSACVNGSPKRCCGGRNSSPTIRATPASTSTSPTPSPPRASPPWRTDADPTRRVHRGQPEGDPEAVPVEVQPAGRGARRDLPAAVRLLRADLVHDLPERARPRLPPPHEQECPRGRGQGAAVH